MQPKNEGSMMKACTSRIKLCILYDLKTSKIATFEVQEQITSHPSVSREVIQDPPVFVCVRDRYIFVVGGCRKMYNPFSKDLSLGLLTE